ncbi:hypothetical protein ACFORL_09490 [Legionella dresdenensis]|uniref:Uncharacterized protein n=1 Tax=Legionella dresdenensis TaxID=450200 RepID=A0ABV8CGF3_9GAMM
MLIQALPVLAGLAINALQVRKPEPVPVQIESGKPQQLEGSYNVRNMSVNDLTQLITELHNAGEISDKDKLLNNLHAKAESVFGSDKETKIDMLTYIGDKIEQMKTGSTNDIQLLERLQTILQGVDARDTAALPVTV